MPQVLWRRRLVEKRQARGVDETEQRAADELVSGPLHIRAKTVIHIENAAIQRHHRNVAGGVLEVGEVLSLGMGEVGGSNLVQVGRLLLQLLKMLSLLQSGHFLLETAHQPNHFTQHRKLNAPDRNTVHLALTSPFQSHI